MTNPKKEKHELFFHIENFNRWAKRHYSIPQDEIFGEWELNYNMIRGKHSWDDIYKAFENFLETTNCHEWKPPVIRRLIYIIARDNEIGWLIKLLTKREDALILLARQSLLVDSSSAVAKWQLAVALTGISDRNLAVELLEQFVEDSDEYVVRRSLMALAEVGSDKVESLCEKLWHKDKYGEWEEYQRMAVLIALHTIKSDKLRHYLILAKEDGRQYLVAEAERIEKEMQEQNV